MRFFLPRRLVEFEYLSRENTVEDVDYQKIAEPYRKDMDFAFFAVNFGYSKQDYEALTGREKAFIYKAWESKIIQDSYIMYNTVFTAFYNANRRKGKRALKLWKKANFRMADMETVHDVMHTVYEVEAREGKNWIDAVYKANGLPIPRLKKNRRLKNG